jgi:hypothetical protein
MGTALGEINLGDDVVVNEAKDPKYKFCFELRMAVGGAVLATKKLDAGKKEKK